MKGSLGLFNKNGSCKQVILKNNMPGRSKQNLEKTFEYMLLVDTKNMSLGVTTWDVVESRSKLDGAGATFKLQAGDFTMLAENVKPTEKNITADELLESLNSIL